MQKKRWAASDPLERRYRDNAKQKKNRTEVTDKYVRHFLERREMVNDPVSVEIIRQRIIMKRSLKELQKWRKENESNDSVVSGKQCENEAAYEVNRGCEQTGYGSCGSSAAGV